LGIWITKIFEDAKLVRLKVDGQIVGTWASVLEDECSKHRAQGRAIVLDFSDVCLVGPQAVGVLRRLRGDGVKFVDVHPLIEELFEDA
jgi:anti-anti-sigma regulatory factor